MNSQNLPKMYVIENNTVVLSPDGQGLEKKGGEKIGAICVKLLKTDTEKMSAFCLSRMLMKTKELNKSFQDVEENKGESRLTRFRGKPEVCGSTGHLGDGAV
jgi:hypothetical protein